MSSLDEIKEIIEGEEKRKWFSDFADYYSMMHKGIFAKKILLNYELKSKQPFLYADCLDDENYSFNIHDLEMGNETMYWHFAAQKCAKANFEGFANIFYPHIGSFRGFLKMEEGSQRLGLVVDSNQRIKKILTDEVLCEMDLDMLIGIFASKIKLNEKL